MVIPNRQLSAPRGMHVLLLLGRLAVFTWPGLHPHDCFTWVLEVFPTIIGAPRGFPSAVHLAV